MKKVLSLSLMAAALLVVQIGFAQTIVGSAHDFSTETWNPTVNDQICIVCHTPHVQVPAIAGAPLWNRGVTATSFTLYTSATLNSVMGQPTGTSKLCLSCHDGTIGLADFGGATGGLDKVTGNALIGITLVNDHPVSFDYNTALSIADPGLRNPSVATGIGTGTIDATMLFGGQLECASCHDVHNSTGIAKLLVKDNASSALCLTCHAK